MKVRQFITSGEVQKEIIVPNLGNKAIEIPAERSGYRDANKQIFGSDMFPKEIPGTFIGYTESISGYWHPTYILVPSEEKLFLGGEEGFKNGPRIIDDICGILRQTGIEVRSVRESDLQSFDYESENFDYWLADANIRTNSFGMKYVSSGQIMYSELLYYKDKNGKNKKSGLLSKIRDSKDEHRIIDSYCIRPVVVLDTVVTNC